MENNQEPNPNGWWDAFVDGQYKYGKKSNYPVWMMIAAYCAEFGVPDENYAAALEWERQKCG